MQHGILRLIFPALLWTASPILSADVETDRNEFRTVYAEYQKLAAEGRFEDALPAARRAHELGVELYGPQDRNTAALAVNLGKCLRHAGENDEAARVLKDALSIYESAYGKDAMELVDPLMELGHASAVPGNSRPQRKYYDHALRIVERAQGRSVLYGDLSMEAATQIMFGAGSIDSERYLENAYHVFMEKLGANDAKTGLATLNMGKYALWTGDIRAAESYLLNLLEGGYGPDEASQQLSLSAHALLVYVYEQQGKSDEATGHCLAVGRVVPETTVHDYAPLYRPEPRYSKKSVRRGQEGAIIVEFTVDEAGRVRDPRVVESQVPEVFEKVALETVVQYRYAPRFVDDSPVPTEGVRDRIDFSRSEEPMDNLCRTLMELSQSYARFYRANPVVALASDIPLQCR